MSSNRMCVLGMKPVLFSVAEAINKGHAHWVRAGSDICYYKNQYNRSSQVTGRCQY